MPFTDYFAAPSDDAAALGARVSDPKDLGFEVLYAKNIDPVVLLGRLEGIVTGLPVDDVWRDDRQGALVSEPGEILVIAVTDRLRDTLARLDAESVRAMAQTWSSAEEFSGLFPVDFLVLFLRQLGELAQHALANGAHLYCRWSL